MKFNEIAENETKFPTRAGGGSSSSAEQKAARLRLGSRQTIYETRLLTEKSMLRTLSGVLGRATRCEETFGSTFPPISDPSQSLGKHLGSIHHPAASAPSIFKCEAFSAPIYHFRLSEVSQIVDSARNRS